MGNGYTRTKIRESLDTALKNISSVANRVITGEEEPNLTLPNITHNIVTTRLDREKSNMGFVTDTSYREFRIEVNGRALLRDGSDDPLDDLCLEIEKEIASATTLNQWAHDLRLESTDYEIAEDEKPIGLATLTYLGNYSEPSTVRITAYADERTSSSITITATTDATGVFDPWLFDNGDTQNPKHGTVIQTSGNTHVVYWTGLQTGNPYIPYYYFDSDPTYLDVTVQFTWIGVDNDLNVITLV